ncbi:MAG: hypothetical protein PHI97_03650 [Desulfobulbus sp.]|nr:hypothetical protein [Desulfobulbus sp.]
MKSYAGITQHLEMSEEYIEKTFGQHKELVFVGPFKTLGEASQWLEYMIAKSYDAEEISLPGYCIDDWTWYGVIFEFGSEIDKHLSSEYRHPVLSGH